MAPCFRGFQNSILNESATYTHIVRCNGCYHEGAHWYWRKPMEKFHMSKHLAIIPFYIQALLITGIYLGLQRWEGSALFYLDTQSLFHNIIYLTMNNKYSVYKSDVKHSFCLDIECLQNGINLRSTIQNA